MSVAVAAAESIVDGRMFPSYMEPGTRFAALTKCSDRNTATPEPTLSKHLFGHCLFNKRQARISHAIEAIALRSTSSKKISTDPLSSKFGKNQAHLDKIQKQ